MSKVTIRQGLNKMSDIQVERVYQHLTKVSPTYSSCKLHRAKLQRAVLKILNPKQGVTQ